MNNKKILYLITSSFPYSYGEAFLEKELLYLNKSFDRVIIFTHAKSGIKRKLTQNNKVVSIRYNLYNFEKLIALLLIFDPKFWKEIQIIKNLYSKNINYGIVKTILSSLFNAKRLKRSYLKNLDNDKYQEVYFYSYWLNDSSIALSLMKSKKNQKIFSRVHRWDVYFEESKFNYLPFRHMIYNNLDAIFSISKNAISYASKTWKLNDLYKFKISRLGIENKFIINMEIRDFFRIVTCSNLISVKRVDLLLESLFLIKSINIEWIVIGDGILRKEIEEKSKILPKNISVFFQGQLNNHDVFDCYIKYQPNLFLNLSSSEGVPVSIMEAMSFGIPVIATDVGGTSEIVNNKNGYLLDEDTSKDLVASKIIEFYNLSNDDKKSMRLSAYNTWENKYNSENNYPQFIDEILAL